MTAIDQVQQLVDRIGEDLAQLVALYDVDTGGFTSLGATLPQLAELEEHMALKAHLDVLIAHLASTEDLMDVAGTSKPRRILKERLGWSNSRANSTIGQARCLYGKLKDEPDETLTEEQNDINRGAAEMLRGRTRRQLCDYRISGDTRTAIDKALLGLRTGSALLRETLRQKAVDYAHNASCDDTRAYVKHLVSNANSELSPEPARAERNRAFTITEADNDGGSRVFGYLPERITAKLRAWLEPCVERTVDKDDPRTTQQRYADALDAALDRGGIGTASMVFSVSAKDFDDADLAAAGMLFPTNTGNELTVNDVLSLAQAKYGFVCVHDPRTGQVLDLRRTTRLANIYQRLALFASELVCSHPGCSEPVSRCDIHHITSWNDGGPTDIANLTLRCPEHHSDNDDTKQHPIKEHAARHPKTGVVGSATAEDPENPVPNTSTAAAQSAGAKIRRQAWPHSPPDPEQ
ncbi:HNH endonuclease signature motif containing protein [Corynebacterium sp. TAE3-ERU2]|uniref:HNH endonuclease signature motif containing protein n=1 Tax=Corynebacterium sp. TAE3-ERU2 TaxID=2849497 RepID=UPI001C47EBC0|nr:HNH endonuclease signature motif containing protein [Corynebacterium sp. TAE3-ERU2]MBV7302463.1 HNH endonuclease [Corynebacterium sp. TAE3-ERU2]